MREFSKKFSKKEQKNMKKALTKTVGGGIIIWKAKQKSTSHLQATAFARLILVIVFYEWVDFAHFFVCNFCCKSLFLEVLYHQY